MLFQIIYFIIVHFFYFYLYVVYINIIIRIGHYTNIFLVINKFGFMKDSLMILSCDSYCVYWKLFKLSSVVKQFRRRTFNVVHIRTYTYILQSKEWLRLFYSSGVFNISCFHEFIVSNVL